MKKNSAASFHAHDFNDGRRQYLLFNWMYHSHQFALNYRIEMNSAVRLTFGQKARNFLRLFFARSNIHGFFYFSWEVLRFLEKFVFDSKSCGFVTTRPLKLIEFCRLFWLVLVISAFCATIVLSLKSLDRYETKSTVVTIERDHYYWNTSLPSLTICPTSNRIDRDYFNEYCQRRGIDGEDKDQFYDFLESMANATYDTFHQIKNYSSVEVRSVSSWCSIFLEAAYYNRFVHRNCTCCQRIIWCWFIIWPETGHGSPISSNASEPIEIGSWFAVSRYSLSTAFVTRPTIFWQPICPQSWCVPIFGSCLSRVTNINDCLLHFQTTINWSEALAGCRWLIFRESRNNRSSGRKFIRRRHGI